MLRKITKEILQRLSSNNYRPLVRIELNRARMLHNIRYIQAQHPDFEIIPVLKGNAYGHGIVPVAKILRASMCNYVAVDGYFEAAKIRDICRQKILVMGYILPENMKLLDTKRCSFVVQDITGLRAFGVLGRPVRIHVELNTGMNRLGLHPDELDGYLEVLGSYPKLQLEGVMTHLADADNGRSNKFNNKQTTLFDNMVERIQAAGFKPKLIHIAQTAGSAKVASKYANALRLGIGTYGINPLPTDDPHFADLAQLKPVLELKSTVIKVLTLKKGDKVSYNGTFIAPGPMCVGVLPLGYYEGVPRSLSNKGFVAYNGRQLPIVGRVCMNHTMVDAQDSGLQPHDEVTVISHDPEQPNSVVALQAEQGLFAYSTLTGLSSSVRREIV